MDLAFNADIANAYVSPSQRARVLTEDWVFRQIYCPGCGRNPMGRYANNHPASDFFCTGCGEVFELKGKVGRIGRVVQDGAYRTMMDRMASNRTPNFFLLAYGRASLSVTDLVVVPSHFFSPAIIEQRPPLAKTAQRAGWVGCNIRLDGIPNSGRIVLVKSGAVCQKADVLQAWRQTLFLRDQGNLEARGWLLEVMKLIESFDRPIFSLSDLYSSSADLRLAYPNNRNVEAKIRQQLQLLRDKGYLAFLGGATYRLINKAPDFTAL